MTLIKFIQTKIKAWFEIVYTELNYVNEWFIRNRLSINAGKTKYLYFHEQVHMIVFH